MFQTILRFMQREDPNGDWLSAEEDEVDYLLEVLHAWIDDGLEVTPFVNHALLFLRELQIERS